MRQMTLREVGHSIVPDFIEEDLIAAFERVLGHVSYPRYPIQFSRISQQLENEEGYDGVLTTIAPMYIQFKRPIFYLPQYGGKLGTERQAILPSPRGFFAFDLHLDRQGEFSQHNYMHTLRNSGHQAFYLVSKFFKASSLKAYKFLQPRFLYHYENAEIVNIGGNRFHIPRVPMFDELVSIPAHIPLTDINTTHSYTYDKDLRIAFHSDPVALPEETGQVFYTTLVKAIRNYADYRIDLDNIENIGRFLKLIDEDPESDRSRSIIRYYSRKLRYPHSPTWGNKANLERMGLLRFLHIIELFLKDNFGIIQYALTNHGA